MGIVVSTGTHERLVAEHEAELAEAKSKADRKREELAEHKYKSVEEEAELEAELKRLESQKAKLATQQQTLQADYSEMEQLRQEREAQVVQRCILRIFQRSLGVCFSEWKEAVTDIIRERDRVTYSSKVEELAMKNKQLKQHVKDKEGELNACEEQTKRDRATQLIMRLKYKEVAICFNQWKGYVRANFEDRHQRSLTVLQQKLEEMRGERDKLRARLTEAEREGLKLAMTKFELEEKDLQKEGHISELADALTQARDTIERQVHQWPSSSKGMRRELTALNSAYEAVARTSDKSTYATSPRKSAAAAAAAEPVQAPAAAPEPEQVPVVPAGAVEAAGGAPAAAAPVAEPVAAAPAPEEATPAPAPEPEPEPAPAAPEEPAATPEEAKAPTPDPAPEAEAEKAPEKADGEPVAEAAAPETAAG